MFQKHKSFIVLCVITVIYQLPLLFLHCYDPLTPLDPPMQWSEREFGKAINVRILLIVPVLSEDLISSKYNIEIRIWVHRKANVFWTN